MEAVSFEQHSGPAVFRSREIPDFQSGAEKGRESILILKNSGSASGVSAVN